jgi:signal transduction histidine kinase
VQARLVLPGQEPPEQIRYTPLLVSYVATVCAGAVVAAVVSRPTLSDPPTLVAGSLATAGMAAFAVRAISGVSVAWSASIFVHLGMTLALGPSGAIAAALAHGLLGGVLVGSGWFRIVFNTATFALTNLAARSAALVVAGSVVTASTAPAAGLGAGTVAWLVNYVLVAVVVRIASNGRVSVGASLRSAVPTLPYNLAYGFAAGGVALLYADAGLVGFGMLLMPVVAGQAFLVLLARRTFRYQQELLHAEEAERRRIARDLHDTVVQVVAGSAMNLSAEADQLAVILGESGERWRSMMVETADELRLAARDLRTLIIEIAPPTLREDGIQVTLQKLVEPLIEQGLVTSLVVDDRLDLADDEAALVFRVAREALRNVAAHAHASHVNVTLASNDSVPTLTVVDDGRGFSQADVNERRRQGHVGTRGIEEVATEAGATLTIKSDPGQGTTVQLQLRCPTEDG